MRSQATELGTERSSTPPWNDTGCTSRNHVFQVASDSWARRASLPICQSSTAVVGDTSVFSTGPSTCVENKDGGTAAPAAGPSDLHERRPTAGASAHRGSPRIEAVTTCGVAETTSPQRGRQGERLSRESVRNDPLGGTSPGLSSGARGAWGVLHHNRAEREIPAQGPWRTGRVPAIARDLGNGAPHRLGSRRSTDRRSAALRRWRAAP